MKTVSEYHTGMGNREANKGASVKKVAIVTGAVILLLLTGNIYQQIKNGELSKQRDQALLEKEFSLSEKLTFEKEFNNAKMQMEALKGKNEELDKLIAEKSAEMDEAKLKMEKLVRENKGISGLKKQIAELKKINSDFEQQANLLIKQNSELASQVTTLKGQNDQLSSKMNGLDDKIEYAKNLKAYNIDVKTMKLTNSGKEISTVKARKTNRIEAEFDIVENVFANAGEKTVQIIIKDPSGMALMEDEEGENYLASTEKFVSPDFNKYTKSMMVNYKNKDHHVSVNYDYDKKLKLKKGSYTLEIYIDGKLTGKKDFQLK